MGHSLINFWQEVFHGVVIGVTVTVIFGLYDLMNKRLNRQKQIKYIRAVVKERIDKMTSAPDTQKNLSGDFPSISVDDVRRALYERMRKDIESAFEHRTSEITFDEKKEVKDALEVIDRVFSNQQTPVGMDLYQYTFDELQKINWLNLSK